jgi:hypothetical protein
MELYWRPGRIVGLGKSDAKPQDVSDALVSGGCYGVSGGAGAMKDEKRYPFDDLYSPGVFENWGHMVKAIGGWVIVGLLFWVAVYELVKW